MFSGIVRIGGGPAGARLLAAGRRRAPQAALALLAVALTTPLGGEAQGGAGRVRRGAAEAVRAVTVSSLYADGGGLAADAAAALPATRYRIVGCRSRGAAAYRSGPRRYQVALGFDDGPAPDTPAFVRMLERNHARATFFVIGRQLGRRYRATLLRELRDGDVIGDHTYTHPDLTRSGDVRGQLSETATAIRELTGYTPCLFRPPYGAYDAAVVRTAASLGLATVLWNVDPRDWALPGTAAIERRVLEQVRPGSIVISHDGGGPRGQTLAAYPTIISALRKRGYGIVTIPQLLGFRPVYEPCVLLCDGIGLSREQLPRNAIVQRAP